MNPGTQPDSTGLGPADSWRQRYEHLRRRVLAGESAEGDSWGLALFVRRGLVAWMNAWPKDEAQAPPPARRASPFPENRATFASCLREQIVMLLVNMILSGRQEVLA